MPIRLLIILSLSMLSQVCAAQDWLPQTNKRFKGNVKRYRYESADAFTSYSATSTYNWKGFLIENVGNAGTCFGLVHDSTVYVYSYDTMLQKKVAYEYIQQDSSVRISTTNYFYNNSNRLTRYICNTSNRKADTVDIHYDNLGRIASYGYPSMPWPNMVYTYDDKGKLIAEKGTLHQDVYQYDKRDNLVSIKRHEHGELSQVTRYKYNALNKKTEEIECSMKTKYNDYEHCKTTYFDDEGYETKPVTKKKDSSKFTYERDKSGRLIREHWETKGFIHYFDKKEYEYFD